MPDDDYGLDFLLKNSEEVIARKAIRVDGGDLGPATKAAIAALAMEPNPFAALYVRSRRLVFPVRLRDRLDHGGIRRPDHALAVHVADRDVVALRLTRVATFHKSAKKGPPREVDPPERICNTTLAAIPWEGIPRLVGTIEAPTVLPTGALVQEPGYDPASGLLLDPGATRFPKIPERPTRADAEKALKFLQKPLEKFPFVTEADRSVALSANLTALVRRCLRAAPVIGYSAPKPASGKTLLATLPSYIATGRVPYLMPPVDEPAEERKRLLAALSECPAAIIIDNIERPFRSSAMCIALTEPEFTDRVLGSTENRSALTNVCFGLTGNNLVIAGDLSSRGLRCEIDPACEMPDAREFELNLHDWVPANRGQLAAAGLTIILAYLAAGAPSQDLPNFARFEQWQHLCRFPLTWLGLADPCATREKIGGADPVQAALRGLLAAWHGCFADDRATLKAAVKRSENAPEGSAAATLRETIEAVAGEKESVNTKRLGNFIAKYERRIEGGLRFERDGTVGGVTYWRAIAPSSDMRPDGFSGFSGFSPHLAGKEHSDFYPKSVEPNPLNPSNPSRPNGRLNGEDQESEPADPPFPPGSIEVEI
jgi:hypothetical protein